MEKLSDITKTNSNWFPSSSGQKLHFPRRKIMSACGLFLLTQSDKDLSNYTKCRSCIRYWNTRNPGDQIDG